MNRIKLLLITVGMIWSCQVHAQLGTERFEFSRKDSLRGELTPPRTCYDVHYYHLDVQINPETKKISGTNAVYFEVMENTELLQIDLFENMDIKHIRLDGRNKLKFRREFDAVFITLPKVLEEGEKHHISIEYGGNPQVAKNPPWDGGFIWTTDSVGNPWVAVACQGTGASLWWPNKDHQSDEPDSMLISVTVPKGLENVSNGRFRGKEQLKNGWTTYDWFVSYPINNYSVTINVGKFAHFDDVYIGPDGDSLTLDYYVLPQELEKAKRQFAQVKPMMDYFYTYFGPYPFVRDGYKMVQSPHLGMEHQTAIAYGNQYLNGYVGTSSSEVGLTFDYIILHETAHEWWGNNITTNDIADMWVHESFGTYSEGLYVEYAHGYDASMKYINSKKQSVKNSLPIVGPFDVNREGSSDMYNKGQLVLNTLRHVIDDKDKWLSILRGLNEKFRYQTIDGQEVFDYINEHTSMDLSALFDQYFRHSDIPTLEVNIFKKGEEIKAVYKWVTDVDNFDMPIKVTTSPGKYELIYPEKDSKSMDLHGMDPDDFKIAEDQFYVNLKLRKIYVDPNK